MTGPRSDARRDEPLLFVEQIFAWLSFNDGQPVQQVALHLRRTVKQARAILFGGQL